MTHLLYIANTKLPSHKAHSVQVVRMCEAFTHVLREEGGTVTLACNALGPTDADPYDFYGATRTFSIRRLWSLAFLWLGPVGQYMQWWSFAKMASLYAFFKQPSLIYTRDEFATVCLGMLGCKPILEVHTKRDTFYRGLVMRLAHKLVFISKGLADHHSARYRIPPKKILIAPDAVSPERFESPLTKQELRVALGIPEDRLIVGHLGKITTMGKGKGVEDLIKGFPAVHKEYPRALLFLAGVEEHEKPYIEELCAASGVAPQDVLVVGHVPQKEFPQYFLVCDVLVMAYPDLEHYRHFMSPIKLFEYMASSVPMVTTDLPSVREILDESLAIFVKPGDADDMARGVREILANPEAAQKRATLARREVEEKYTWDKRAEKILEFVQNHGN